MGDTNIEWTDKTWNPTRGCSRVSPGCANCYAERQALRQKNTGYKGLVTITNGHPAWTGVVREVQGDTLEAPLHWRNPSRVFVNSMSDLFHESLPDEAIDRVFAVIARCPQHTFQILTKRPDRMREYLTENGGHEARRRIQDVIDPPGTLGLNHDAMRLFDAWPLPNVWIGVSVEDQQRADERIPLLFQTPAAVRFVSYEPALGPVDFDDTRDWLTANKVYRNRELDGNLETLDWLICGGESGPGARSFKFKWALDAEEQCRLAHVPFFMKQVGSNSDAMDWMGMKLRDKKGGDPDEWPTTLRVRESPKVK